VYHGPGPHPYADEPPVAALEAIALFTAAAAAFVLIAVMAGGGLAGLALAQIGGLAGVAIAHALARGDAAARLGLAPPPARAIVGAILVGASLWYVNLSLAAPIARALQSDEVARLERTLATPPLGVRLLVVAALPAICEELLCRGVLARALQPALGRALAVIVSALLFAALHLSLVRLVPTFVLGAALGAITLAARSVWPAMLAHFVNNAITIALAGGELAPLGRAIDAHPTTSLVVASLASILGLVIALAPRRAA
jgi:membrane protease YdiL (CAAX protease family)